jgi:hypothetical protein
VISLNALSAVRKVTDQYKDLFSQRGINYRAAASLITMPMLGVDTLSDLARSVPGSYSVSTLSREVQKFAPNRFLRRMQARVLRCYKGAEQIDPANFCYAVDDTANPKYGDGIFRSHPNHSSAGPYKGQKVLLIALVDIARGIAIPLTYAFLTSKKDPAHVKAPTVALGLLKDLLDEGFPPVPVVADSWFDAAEFIGGLQKMGLTFAGEIKSTRNVQGAELGALWTKLCHAFAAIERERLQPRRSQRRRSQRRGKAYAQRQLRLNKIATPLNVIGAYNRIDGAYAFAYYATTDLSMPGAKLWQYSRARWCIECLFRDLKQNLSFGRLPCAGEPGADLSVCLPLMLVVSLRLDGPATWGSNRETIGKTLASAREKAFADAIELLVNNPDHPRVALLRARRANIRKKPTNVGGREKAA